MSICSKCQSDKIIPDLRIIDQAGNTIRLGINVYDHPDALVFRGTHSSTLYSQICGECGHVESYVQNPQELYSVYLASKQPAE